VLLPLELRRGGGASQARVLGERARACAEARKLAPSDGWQTTAAAVARRVVEDEQEDVVEDEEIVQEEDLSDVGGGLCRSSEVGGASAQRGRYWRTTGPGREEGRRV
jgi:hypothetical protein